MLLVTLSTARSKAEGKSLTAIITICDYTKHVHVAHLTADQHMFVSTVNTID